MATIPQLSLKEGNTVQVRVSADVMFNLEKAQAVQKKVLGRLGCPGCTSGFNLSLVALEREFVVDAQLDIRPAGPG